MVVTVTDLPLPGKPCGKTQRTGADPQVRHPHDIADIERIDQMPYCMLLESNDKLLYRQRRALRLAG